MSTPLALPEFWTQEEWDALDTVQSMDELADNIAIPILRRMSLVGKPIYQVCGPMSTGGFWDLSKNMELFDHVIKKAKSSGYLVFDQTPFQKAMIRICRYVEGQDEYPIEILEKFYAKLFKSGLLNGTLFIPDYMKYGGYKSSRGGVWEFEMAVRLSIPVDHCPVEWLLDFHLFSIAS